MIDFFRDMSVNPFLGAGLLAGLLASVACGVIGPYVVARRIVFLAGAIAHAAVGGLGAALWLAYRWPDAFGWMRPLHGALAAAVIGAVAVGVTSRWSRQRSDALIGAMWAVGMAVGVMLAKLTPGYQADLLSYLFGNIVLVPTSHLVLMGVLDAVLLGAAALLHRRIAALCIDEPFAAQAGIDTTAVELALLVLVAMAVVVLVQVVGLVLVLTLLTLPAAAALRSARGIGGAMAWSVLFAAFVTTVPRIAVYGSPISPEPAIVLAAAALFALVVALRRRREA